MPPRLVRQLARLDDPSVPIAETWRRLGRSADRMGVTRPSYERVRVLVHRFRALSRPATGMRASSRLALRARAHVLFLEHVVAVGFRRLE